MSSISPTSRVPEKPADILPWLKLLIEEQKAESSSLEFKSGAVLDRENRNQMKVKHEMSKDASAMANANGGVIIYGIEETSEPGERKAAKGFSPVTDSKVTRETIDQILADHVRPPLQGLRIEEVILPPEESPAGGRCFVVEIPSASTAHQAGDLKYWRRRTVTTEAMEHYEIMEVMNRATHPDVDCDVFIIYHPMLHGVTKPSSVHVRVRNDSTVFCRFYYCRISFPMMLGVDCVRFTPKPHTVRTEMGTGFLLKVKGANLFPGDQHHRSFTFEVDGTPESIIPADRERLCQTVLIEIFADEMPKKPKQISVEEAMRSGGKIRRDLLNL